MLLNIFTNAYKMNKIFKKNFRVMEMYFVLAVHKFMHCSDNTYQSMYVSIFCVHNYDIFVERILVMESLVLLYILK